MVYFRISPLFYLGLSSFFQIIFCITLSSQEAYIRTGFENSVSIYRADSSSTEGLIIGKDESVPEPNDWNVFNQDDRFDKIFTNYLGSSRYMQMEVVNDPIDDKNQVLCMMSIADDESHHSLSRCQVEMRTNNIHESFYTTQRVYLPASLDTVYRDLFRDNKQRWMLLSEHKGAPHNLRISLVIAGKSGVPEWRVEVTDIIKVKGQRTKYPEIWTKNNSNIKVPTGQWFTLEQFIKAGPAGEGRVYVAIKDINGHRRVIFDERLRVQSRVVPMKLGNWHVLKSYVPRDFMAWYTSKGRVFKSYRDDFQFWSDFPPYHPESSPK